MRYTGSADFSTMLTVEESDALRGLMKLMIQQNYSESVYKLCSEEIEHISHRVYDLVSKNYFVQEFENIDGALCAHYPPTLFVPWPRSELYPISEIRSLISQAKCARCRTRFVIPAFAFNGKNVCRSSTLSGPLEVYGRQVANVAGFGFDTSLALPVPLNDALDTKESTEDDRSTFSRLRDADCELLKRFKVHYICDFMLEYKKMKYWVPVTSSEKADLHDRYHDFQILPLPYPGSEFFRVWRDSGYVMRGLIFDWEQPAIEVSLRPDCIRKTLLSADIDWEQYKTWDATTLTTNYLKLLLGLLFEGSGGMLLHCVSGWDRTPLFVSLMRCLLWADDLAHQSLSSSEMLYLTLAYDWYLFGHKLRTRLEIGEEILRFAFCYLAEVADDATLSVSATYHMVVPPEYPTAENGPQKFVEVKWSPHLSKLRQERLHSLTKLFFSMWDDEVESSGIPRAFNPSSMPSDANGTDNEESLSKSAPIDSSPTSNQFHQPMGAMVSQLSNVVTSAAVAVMSGLTRPLTGSRSVSESGLDVPIPVQEAPKPD